MTVTPPVPAGPRGLPNYDSGTQTGSLGSTTLFTAPFTGMFAIDYYLTITSATAGSSNLTLNWTDENSNAQANTWNSGTFSAPNWAYNRFVIFAKSGTNVTFTTTVAGTISYIVHLRAMAEQ